MTRAINNLLRVLLFSAVAVICILVLGTSASEAHSPAHKKHMAFEELGTASHQSCPMPAYNHPFNKPCPSNHLADGHIPVIGKECGGSPTGTVPSVSYDFSKQLTMETIFLSHPVLGGEKLFTTHSSYQSFPPDPFEHPPQSL